MTDDALARTLAAFPSGANATNLEIDAKVGGTPPIFSPPGLSDSHYSLGAIHRQEKCGIIIFWRTVAYHSISDSCRQIKQLKIGKEQPREPLARVIQSHCNKSPYKVTRRPCSSLRLDLVGPLLVACTLSTLCAMSLYFHWRLPPSVKSAAPIGYCASMRSLLHTACHACSRPLTLSSRPWRWRVFSPVARVIPRSLAHATLTCSAVSCSEWPVAWLKCKLRHSMR